MSIVQKFLKGSALLFIANLASRTSGILVLALLSRLLPPQDFGIYSLIFWVVLSGTAIAKLGCDIAIHRNGARLYKTDPEAASRYLGVGGLLLLISFVSVSLILYVWRVPLAIFWLENADASHWLQYAAFLLTTEGLGIIFMTGLLALHNFKSRSIAVTSGSLARLLIVPILAFFYGVSGALAGLCCSSFLQATIAIIYFRNAATNNYISLNIASFGKEARKILSFALPYYVGDASIGLLYLPVMRELRQAAGLESLGYLRIAQSLSQLISFLPAVIAPVLVSLLSEAHGSDTKDFEKLRSIHFRGNWLLGLLIVTFVTSTASSIVEVIFGKTYIAAVPLVIGMAWGSLVTVVAQNLNLYSISAGNMKLVSLGAITEKATFIGSSLWSIQYFNGMGFVLSRLVAILLQFLVMLFGLWYSLDPVLKNKTYTLTIITIVAALISYGFSILNISILLNGMGALLLTVSLMLVAFTLVFSNQEVNSIRVFLKKMNLNH